jgi:hypothetical protein
MTELLRKSNDILTQQNEDLAKKLERKNEEYHKLMKLTSDLQIQNKKLLGSIKSAKEALA